MRKTTFGTILAVAALSATAIAPAAATPPADRATEPSATISGAVGDPIEFGSPVALRYVGDPAPANYVHSYQHGDPRVLTESPETDPVTMEGTLDLSEMAEGEAVIIGLYDAEALAAGQTAHKQGAGIYVADRGGHYDIGVSDGDAGGGEFVQSFVSIPVPDELVTVEFTVDGQGNTADCASDIGDTVTADGCMELIINGGEFVVTDSYGSVSPAGIETELAEGGIPGWLSAYNETQPEIGAAYNLTITPVQLQTRDQCQDGGFVHYDFKNQGQCVSSLLANGHAHK